MAGLPQQRDPLDHAGLERAFLDAGLATILNSTSPIFTFFLTLAITRHEALAPRKLFGVCAGMAGICLIVGVEALGGLGQQLVAQIVAVLAAVCYAGAAIFGRGFKGLDPMAPAAGSLLCGAAMLIPLSLVVDRPWTLAPSANSLLALLVLAVFSTALAFVIYFRLVQTLGSVGTTAQAYLRVPIGVAVGVVFLGESLTRDGMDRAWLCRGRGRGDDDSGEEGNGGQRIVGRISASVIRHLLHPYRRITPSANPPYARNKSTSA